MRVRRGVLRGFAETGWVFLPEFTLPNGRRADLFGINTKGQTMIIEIKSSLADFMADGKWTEYLGFCDVFYFASHVGVPLDVFPAQEGFILADEHDCHVVREGVLRKMAAPSRKSLTLRFARSAALRLHTITQA